MPVGAVLLLELPEAPSEPALAELRDRLMSDLQLDREDFYCDGPLRLVTSRSEGPVPVLGNEASCWLDVNLWNAYYGPEYPRGDIVTIVRCADWLERHCPGATVWYGDDVSDDSIVPFPRPRRQALLDHQRRQIRRSNDSAGGPKA